MKLPPQKANTALLATESLLSVQITSVCKKKQTTVAAHCRPLRPLPLTKKVLSECAERARNTGKTIEVSDGKETGLKALVSPVGNISLILRKSRAGKNKYVPIGHYPDISIEVAREIARKIKSEFSEGVKTHSAYYGNVTGMAFDGLINVYKRDVLDAGTKRSAHTDRSKINKYIRPRLGDIKVTGMTQADITHYLSGLDNLKPATRNRHLALIKAIFTYAQRLRLMTFSPAQYIRAQPETTSQRRAMSENELRLWFHTCEQMHNREPDNAAISLLLFLALTGLRLGETRHLCLEDIDWSHKVITLRQTKNGKLRRVPVCDRAFVLLTEIRQHQGDKGWVFSGKGTDNPVSEPRRLQKRFCEAAGIPPFTIHELRHSFATRLVEDGVDIHTVKDLLGHSSIKVTELYLHASPARYHAAINQAMGRFWM